jgi:cell wall assembly regulator SMI1
MADVDEWQDPNHWHKGWYAFASSGGDCLVIDPLGSFGGVAGQVVDFNHEGDAEKTIVAPDFDSWLGALVEALETGVLVYNPEDEDVSDGHGMSLDSVISSHCKGYPKTVTP